MPDRRPSILAWLLRAAGLLLLLAGLGLLILAPLETICFEWFAEGGRFGYPGFGFGSFMFGNITMQIVGYYLIAAILFPLGYGHLTLRPWIKPLTLALIWCWLVLGIPLASILLFILLASKELTVLAAVAAIAVVALAYAALPGVLLRLYGSRALARTLANDGPAAAQALPAGADPAGAAGTGAGAASAAPNLGGLGVPVLVLLGLDAFYVVALHMLLLFRGLFPVWTGWATGLQGLALIDGAVVVLLLLVVATVKRWRWAWWGTLAYFGAMLVLWVGTLVRTTWAGLLDILAFPPTEVDILDGIPLQGWHLAALVGLPLLLTLVAVFRARPAFSRRPGR